MLQTWQMPPRMAVHSDCAAAQICTASRIALFGPAVCISIVIGGRHAELHSVCSRRGVFGDNGVDGQRRAIRILPRRCRSDQGDPNWQWHHDGMIQRPTRILSNTGGDPPGARIFFASCRVVLFPTVARPERGIWRIWCFLDHSWI